MVSPRIWPTSFSRVSQRPPLAALRRLASLIRRLPEAIPMRLGLKLRRRNLGLGGYRDDSCLYGGEWPSGVGGCRSADAAGAVPAGESAPDRHSCRMRHVA